MNPATMNSIIPPWLQEHCSRLKAMDSDITNLNLNIRQLNRPMMTELSKALCVNPRIEIINFTSSLMNNVARRPPPTAFRQQRREENMWQPQNVQQRQVEGQRSNNPTTALMGGPYDAALPLAELVLPDHPSLQKIHLSYNRLSCCISIGDALVTNTVLKELHLDYNLLGTSSAIALANGLKYNKSLRVLQLKSNKIDDVGGVAIANSLRSNTTLKHLGLSNNLLGVETGKVFLNVLKIQNISLTHLTLDENTSLPMKTRQQIQYYTRANQVGIRHILRYYTNNSNRRHHQFHQKKRQKKSSDQLSLNSNSSSNSIDAIWPCMLEQLEPDMIYFFLQQKPDLF